MAAELLRIQAVRDSSPGLAYPADTDWQKQFEEEFPYTETEDQLSTLSEIKGDLGRPRPMDRLLCGDVGFGKTELAIRAAFKVVEAGKQVAVLVPTTVLAAQHLRTFSERFADYPFRVDVISRFRSKGEQQQLAKRALLGQVDILIGTHRLLSEDIHFADLGLVVIDEEQRFGVAHKERFKSMRATVDVLTMTATPIPRTLHMALLGLRDISNLATPPMDRRAIHTEVTRFDEGMIRQAILRELNRQGQVFFLHNRVQTINRMAQRITELVPEARIAVGHGQMAAGQLERIMLDFVAGAYDILVCTTIIESGLDIPTANTMFIANADRFGLAELHQLRGRVGRYKHRAYCYLLLPETRSISPIAAKRLKAVEEFSDLGAGFQIAMRDLEIRGAGNILGAEQSGHIAQVGYELYCQLLEEAVRELRGEKPPPRKDVNVDLGISAYIPRNYIPADRQRMEVYRRIVRCSTLDELGQLREDLVDAYGKIPDAVETLLDQAQIRVLAGGYGVESIILMAPDLIFSIRDWSMAKPAFAGAAGSVRRPDEKTVYWRPPERYLEPQTLLRVLANQLKKSARRVP
jgi:transcription-repair coupling factor (superfamily II helicase)